MAVCHAPYSFIVDISYIIICLGPHFISNVFTPKKRTNAIVLE